MGPGSNEDTDESTGKVYEYGTKTTSDSAANYILDEYVRPAESWKLKDSKHSDHHTRKDLKVDGSELNNRGLSPRGSVREHDEECG